MRLKDARLKAVLLDIDGTLVDSNDAHAGAWVEALGEAGHIVTFDRMRRLIGKGGDKVLTELTGLEKDDPEAKTITTRRGEIFKNKYLPQIQPFPGVKAALERMHADGLRLVPATSAKKDEMTALLALTGATELFYHAASSDDADHSKPDPDIIDAALRKSDSEPDEALMLGDTPYDILAAAAAGVQTVALRSGGWSAADLAGAIAVYENIADLLADYDRSPFFRRKVLG